MKIETTTTLNNPSEKKKIFDWEKAEELIEKNNPSIAYIFLKEDENTRIKVYEKGYYLNKAVDISSYWATPSMILDDQVLECWRWEED